MKAVVVVLWLAFLLIDPGKIGRINSLKGEAKTAFQSGDFKTAIQKYKYLIDSLGVTEDEVRMNLANAYFHSNDTLNASSTYMPLSQSDDRKIKSLANQQLGVLSNRQSKAEDALNYFKQALKAAPENDDARFNYEMVKKKLEDQKKQDQQNQDKNKDNKDQKKDQDKKDQKQDEKKDQNKDQKEQDKKEQDKKEQEKKDQEKKDQEKKKQDAEKKNDDKNKDKKDIPPSVSEKLKDMQMSEEKAKMILEAMKNQEIQYLQQNKRKATKPRDRTKPDW